MPLGHLLWLNDVIFMKHKVPKEMIRFKGIILRGMHGSPVVRQEHEVPNTSVLADLIILRDVHGLPAVRPKYEASNT